MAWDVDALGSGWACMNGKCGFGLVEDGAWNGGPTGLLLGED